MTNTMYLNALRRFAAGKRIGLSKQRYLTEMGCIAQDEYGSLILTPRGQQILKQEGQRQ